MTALEAGFRWLAGGLGLAAMVYGWFVLDDIAEELPLRTRLVSIEITPTAGPVFLGHAELLQPANGPTGARHIAIAQRDADIVLYDVTANRRVGFVPVGEGYQSSNRAAIAQGRSDLIIGPVTWTITREDDMLELDSGTGTRATLSASGMVLQRKAVTVEDSVGLLETAMRFMRKGSRSYRIGGQAGSVPLAAMADNKRIPDARLPSGAAAIVWRNDGWWVQRGREAVALVSAGSRIEVEASPIVLSSNGEIRTERLVIGRTHYEVRAGSTDQDIRLRPTARVAWVDEAKIVDDAEDAGYRTVRADSRRRIRPEKLATSIILGASIVGILTALSIVLRLGRARAAGLATVGAVFTFADGSSLLGVACLSFGAGLLTAGALEIMSRGLRYRSGGYGAWLALIVGLGLCVLALFGEATALLSEFEASRQLPDLASGLEPWIGNFGAFGGTGTAELELALAGVWIALSAPLLATGLPATAAVFWALLAPISTYGVVAGARLVALEPLGRWLPLLEKHLIVLAGIAVLACMFVALADTAGPILRRIFLPRRRRWWMTLAMILPLGALVVLTSVGNETGFLGIFQPSELAKSALVILVAATLSSDLARRTILSASDGSLKLEWPFIALFLVVAIMMASALNYDMSPIIVSVISLLVALAAGTVLHTSQLRMRHQTRRHAGLPIIGTSIGPARAPSELWGRIIFARIARHSSLWPVVSLSVVILILAALATWLVTHRAFREGAAPNLPGWMVTPWKRIQSWFDMALDAPDGAIIDLPETGSQLLRAREALLEVHCTLEQLCPANIGSTRGPAATEALLRLPAAQDDFAAVSLIHALGVDGAVLYFALQVAMIVAGLVIGFHALLVRVDFRFGAWLTGCIAIGMTAVVAAQIALAWGNVLGGLPIMGQPMTFVSFGASHHLGVAMPFALAIVATTLVMRAPATVDRQNRIRSMIYKRRVA